MEKDGQMTIEDALEPEPRNRVTDLAEGRKRRDAGENLALSAEALWREQALLQAAKLAGSGQPFTAEDITDVVGMPKHKNAMGGLFGTIKSKGWAVPVGFTQATRKEAHARVIRIWQKEVVAP